eukprot:gnl/MRDRNA2_/MRDRNA2_192684_c0_seq1.p1 gnl/MRDRNA2_/MRDRNA2_192684_c0~~gnl/MRDRNA2_/MRDRNA2_192684_c0_seq1.p1  ORF type:complete len:444 (+),score=80.45 gnl/MRDRNA2_/MRDRNA2_192684_c0_seq1:189-1334(+)
MTQILMPSKLQVQDKLQCTLIEVKTIEGLGATIDCVLISGTLREGDIIVCTGLNGPIVTAITALLTPNPMTEMRVKNEYVHHKQLSASMGVKICAPDIELAVPGAALLVCGPDDDLDTLKAAAEDDFDAILHDFERKPQGVFITASNLGSLKALQSFLEDSFIPVCEVAIGEVHPKHVEKAQIMKDEKHPEYATILAFDVKVSVEAKAIAQRVGVQIMSAGNIYHLFDQLTTYMKKVQDKQKTDTRSLAVFPVILRIIPQHVFNERDPIIVACDVIAGQLKIGTPLCVPEAGFLQIGRVIGIEINKDKADQAQVGQSVCVTIQPDANQTHIQIGRHLEARMELYSSISRDSIDTLKENFRNEMTKEDWQLIIQMKKLFQIQ